jgi:hydroxymethylglutaryl-CoA reductase
MKFYELSPQKRRLWLENQGIKLDWIDSEVLSSLNKLSENVVGQLRLPVGLIKNLIVNDHHYIVPLATEEPSVVAAANHGASLFAQSGGVRARSYRDGIYGQIVMQVTPDFHLHQLTANLSKIIEKTNQHFLNLVNHGGGVRKIIAKHQQELLYLKVLIDPAEAMGANRANTILEFMAIELVKFSTIQQKLFAILSNYPSQLTTAKVKLGVDQIGGMAIAKRIALLSQIGQTDVFRAVTNNKGIMNGIDGVLLATGNDTRAVEAACGVWASQNGTYTSLSQWQIEDDNLIGELTVPLAIGTVGGSIKVRNDIRQNYRILGKAITTAELAEVIAATGLANNLAALLAIATTGIQQGHMKLQARNIVAELNATEDEKKIVLQQMVQLQQYSQTEALKLLNKIREGK